MDALTFLRTDHEGVLGILESLERGRGGGEAEVRARGDLVTTLVIAESQHEAIEEQFFWPEVRRTIPDGDELADRAIDQEDGAKKLLQQLKNSHAGTPEFERALTEFIPAARAHIEFEQSEVWPAFREVIPAETSNELGRKMAAAKAMAPTRPHPGTPSTPGYLKSVGMVAAVVDKIRDMLTGRRSHYPPTAPPA
ncbi:hemerythrin domain-containing protein [Nocardia beijingensis]|uniref:hemerythrin domain-containing protein n=1 Tax=Nocardia beijingensis TaxID=95162 RepID=UPI001894870D|nr:hemerythrin domain-containing protein [Nocardia beijingensis]MBF6073928.1 hemerythrin domain-containing protein [Nocardia beijingensis]